MISQYCFGYFGALEVWDSMLVVLMCGCHQLFEWFGDIYFDLPFFLARTLEVFSGGGAVGYVYPTWDISLLF